MMLVGCGWYWWSKSFSGAARCRGCFQRLYPIVVNSTVLWAVYEIEYTCRSRAGGLCCVPMTAGVNAATWTSPCRGAVVEHAS